MSEQEPMKVYELAKELGLDSLSLLDKLKKIDISVKSHMSSLDSTQIQKARFNFTEKLNAKIGNKTKKTLIRKRPVTAVKKKTTDSAIKVVSKIISRKKIAVGAKTTTTTQKKQPAAPIIRRRLQTDGTPTSTELGSKNTKEAKTTETASNYVHLKTTASKVELKTTEVEIKKRSLLNVIDQNLLEKKKSLQIVKPAEKKSQIPTLPAQDPTQLPVQIPGRGKIIKMNKESLDRMAQEEAAKKKLGTGVGGREARRPEDRKFADYRKKEMIFLPKRKRVPIGKQLRKTQITTPKASKRIIEIDGGISVGDLAAQLGVKGNEIIRKLIKLGNMATINQILDLESVQLITSDYQYDVKNIEFDEKSILDSEADETSKNLKLRPPIVTVMGHVDHGKTSLLDAIKDSNVVAKEAGGITQHIGAYTVERNGKKITFIDTPGHEAFSVMRARGANVTDIIILVVAADDGVMPQTREAVSHAKEAGVPIIVAVNKIDKPDANPEKTKQGLAELDLLSEDWGGQTMFVPVSALKKQGIDELLEAISLNAELLELKANPDQRAEGIVLEAKLEKGKGPVVSILIQKGTLKQGDYLVSGVCSGKVRAMSNHLGQEVKEVLPGMAAEILGLSKVPNAGEKFYSTKDEADGKRVIENRSLINERNSSTQTGKMTLDDLFAKIEAGNLKELKVVLKGDVFGSVEAIKDNLSKLSTEKVKVNVIHNATGGITESDVLLASASNAVIFGFNVRPETKARITAESENVEVKCYNVIYELFDDVKKAMTGLLDKKEVEKFLGRAEVRQTFSVPKIGVIAGSAVIDGKIIRGASVRLLRDSLIIFEGKMNSLKRFKDDAKEVSNGFECGIGLENFNDVKAGDIIEAYEIELVKQEL